MACVLCVNAGGMKSCSGLNMDPEDEMWEHLANKLANEATEDELRKLDELLKQNPGMHSRGKQVSEWWQDGQGQEQNDDRLFEKILKRIKTGEDNRTREGITGR